jgi:hypothetical protein
MTKSETQPQQQDAPERIWLQRGQALDPSECTLSHVSTDGTGEVEYIRADLCVRADLPRATAEAKDVNARLQKIIASLLTKPVYEDGEKANGIAVKFLMRLNQLAYEVKLEGYSMDNPFVAESLSALGETEICPVCKNEVPTDSMLSYNNVPNAFCQGCVDSGNV